MMPPANALAAAIMVLAPRFWRPSPDTSITKWLLSKPLLAKERHAQLIADPGAVMPIDPRDVAPIALAKLLAEVASVNCVKFTNSACDAALDHSAYPTAMPLAMLAI